MACNPFYKVLSIAGFDGSGGAGLQADLKTFSALGCYGTTVITALPVQNTMGVRSVYDISAQCVKEQMESIFDDIGMNAVKIGMLHRTDIIETVAYVISQYNLKNIVLDPVMLAKSGDRLLHPNAIAAMKKHLFPIATLLTPNLPEASELLGREIRAKVQMEQAALELLEMGPKAVVVKGGHLDGDCCDCIAFKNPTKSVHWLTSPRIRTKNTHGTGCTFSAAIATFVAKGFTVLESVKLAKAYLTEAIKAGANMKIGHGNGPVHHFHNLWSIK